MVGFMTSADATVFAAVIGAAAVIISIVASLFIARASAAAAAETARASASAAVETKLNELRQTQIRDIVRQRILRYPSLWSFCQENITLASHSGVPDEWASKLSDELERWHTENGIFLSQSTYLALFYLRTKARRFAKDAVSGADAAGPLNELTKIWQEHYTDKEGVERISLSTSMKNDLGSYAQAALSQ
jgi:hypothetical protein